MNHIIPNQPPLEQIGDNQAKAADSFFDDEFRLLREYMSVYIQLLPECRACGGMRLQKAQLPTFDYFKQTYADDRYSLSIPGYKESKAMYDGRIVPVHTHGLGSIDGVAFRYYNYWMGCKFFTGDNIEGNYTVKTEDINELLKNL